MSRDIKFRAWDKEENKMSWVTGLDFRRNHEQLSSPIKITEVHTNYDIMCYPEIKDFLVLMQYTGLEDKNGVEIYEGDIIIIDGNTTDVFFNSSCACFDVDSQDLLSYFDMYNPYDFEVEVIGNIYENPELLEGGEDEN